MSRKNSVIIPWGLLFYTIRTGYCLILLPYVPEMKKILMDCFCIHIYLDLEFVSDSDSVQVLYRITDRQ